MRKEKAEEEEQVQRVQEENGELRQMIVQLEEYELKNKMEVKEQLEIKNNYFSWFSRCIVVFGLLGLLFVLMYSTM